MSARDGLAASARKTISDLEEFKEYLFKQCLVKHKIFWGGLKQTNLRNTHEQRFVLHKLNDYQNKYNRLYQKIVADYLLYASVINDFIKKELDLGNSAQCLVKKLYESLSLDILNNKKLSRYHMKGEYLDAYSHRIEMDTLLPDIPLVILMSNLKESTKFVDQQASYCCTSTFDDVFTMYLKAHPSYDAIHNDIKVMVKENKIDFSCFNDLYQRITEIVPTKCNKTEVVLKSTLIRFIFDELYEDIYEFDPLSDVDHIKKCSLAQMATPIQLKISPSLIPQAEMSTPFSVLSKKYLPDAQRFLSSIPFLVAANDIVYNIHLVLKQIDRFANTSNQTKGIAISFDDCFSLFWPIFCGTFPSGVTLICKMINNCNALHFSSSLEFSKLMLISAANYSEEIDLNK